MLRINSKHIITTRDDGLYVRPSTTHFYELYQPPHDVWRHLLSTQAQHLASTQTLITNNTNTTGNTALFFLDTPGLGQDSLFSHHETSLAAASGLGLSAGCTPRHVFCNVLFMYMGLVRASERNVRCRFQPHARLAGCVDDQRIQLSCDSRSLFNFSLTMNFVA
jgi:hypothetical protein